MTERRLARSRTAKVVIIAVLIGGTALALWATLPPRPRPEEETAGPMSASEALRGDPAANEGYARAPHPATNSGASAEACFGAVTFVHRFGSALNANLHFHCAVIDGVFSAHGEGVQFSRSSATLSCGYRRRATRGAYP